jgi:MoxR-like ATPase
MNTSTAKKTRISHSTRKPPESVLSQLGIIGMESVEPAILGALIGGEPLLLIGPHGTGKSYLLNRICAALGLEWRHYNASLLNYDDLVGFPLPGKDGTLEYVQTPASIWGAEAVFIDEISRCRPDLQNKLFPIIHECRVQGILLDKLVYRWSAMNPPSNGDDDEDAAYRGSEPLDAALADRFAFIIATPSWDGLSETEQEKVILATGAAIPEASAQRLRFLIASGRSLLPALREELSAQLAAYVRIAAGLLLQGGIAVSPRRAGTVLRNILAVHSARLAQNAAVDPAESAWLALSHSLPQPAAGERINPVKVLVAHREAWKIAGMSAADPRRIVLLERDPLIRPLRAAQVDSIAPAELSVIVADALATLPPGARHALAAAFFESGAAGRLVAAVAEQCAALFGLAATPQDVQEPVHTRSLRYDLWTWLAGFLSSLDPKHADTPPGTNLLVGLFASGQIADRADAENAWKAWSEARKKIRGFYE